MYDCNYEVQRILKGKFQSGRCWEAERSRTSVTEVFVIDVSKMLGEDRQATNCQIYLILKISYACDIHFFSLGTTQPNWRPEDSTCDMVQREIVNIWYMKNIMTGKKIWLCYFEVLTKSQNKVWAFKYVNSLITIRNLR